MRKDGDILAPSGEGGGHRSPSSSVHPPVLTETWRQERNRVFLVSLDDVVSLE